MTGLTRQIARLRSSVATFRQDESGSATVWNMIWLIAFGVMAGLSIDSANAWRNKTMMIATTDAATLGGAYDLPEDFLELNYSEADLPLIRERAFTYATTNMDVKDHGWFILPDSYGDNGDIYIGHWDPVTRSFTNGPDISVLDADDKPINAVHVRTYKTPSRFNSVPMSLLQWASWFDMSDRHGTEVHGNNQVMWDVEAAATAYYGKDSCKLNGIISRGQLFVASNATFHKSICLHGQQRVDIQNNVVWLGGAVSVTTGNPVDGVPGGDEVGVFDVKNGQYADEAQTQQIPVPDADFRYDRYPMLVDAIPTMAWNMMTGVSGYRHFTYPSQDPGTSLPTIVVSTDEFEEIMGTDMEPPYADSTTDPGDKPTTAEVAGYTTRYEELDQIKKNGKNDWPEDIMDITLADLEAAFAGSTTGTLDKTTIPAGTTSMIVPGNVMYFIEDCGPNNVLSLGPHVHDMTVIAKCKIDIPSNSVVENTVLVSLFEKNSENTVNSITIGSGVRLGAETTCQGWGGVRLYSQESIHASAGSLHYNVGMVAADDIHFAGRSDGTFGISLQAGDQIEIAANAEIGALDSSAFPPNPAGGCPDDGVGPVVDATAFRVALVE